MLNAIVLGYLIYLATVVGWLYCARSAKNRIAMPLMMENLYDALLAAHVPDDKARAAAVEAAQHETRFATIETRLGALEARVTMLTWAIGLDVALTIAVLGILLAGARH